ncbi:MAG: shikimate 5-dehydrogenase [Kiloniellaceae bacterium]
MHRSMIDGKTLLIAHLGYPTESFTAPMIYNPYFEKAGINAVVMPLGVQAEAYPEVLRALLSLTNFHGALITMPHKVTTLGLVDEASPTARIAGACNALRKEADGRLRGDMFDGEGFLRGLQRRGRAVAGARGLVVGCGGVGSAIAASLARAGAAALSLYDVKAAAAEALAGRLRQHYPALAVGTGNPDPAGHDIVVNATPLGMGAEDPLPLDAGRLDPAAVVGEVVLSREVTPLLAAARARGCDTQVGTDMLFEMIPAYLEFFGFPAATAEELRRVARLAS